jgi:hypothetical protein
MLLLKEAGGYGMTYQMHNEDSGEEMGITDNAVTKSVSKKVLRVLKRRLEIQSGVSLWM